MTSKAHPDGPVGRAQLIMLAAGLDNDTFWNALTAYHRVIPSLASDGTYTTSILNNDTLTVFAATSPDRMAQEVENQFAPWREDLDNHRTPYSAKYTSLNNYYDHLLHYFNPYPFGAFTITQLTGGGRLGGRPILESQNSTRSLVDTFHFMITNRHFYIAMEFFDLTATESARSSHHQGQIPSTRLGGTGICTMS